jgi:hypothetical protein
MQTLEQQVDRNFEAFQAALPSLLPAHAGKYALLHKQKITGYFESSITAVIEGVRQYGYGEFSVQHVSERADDLGFYSYAGGAIEA